MSLNRIYGIIIALCKYIDCLVVLVSGVLDDHFKRIPHITKCDDTLKNPHWSITIRAECRLKNSRLGRKPANKLKIYSKMFQQSLAVNDPVFLKNFFFKCLNLFHNYLPLKKGVVLHVVIYVCYFAIISPFMWPFIWSILNSHHPRMMWAKFGWSWRCCSEEDFQMLITYARHCARIFISKRLLSFY